MMFFQIRNTDEGKKIGWIKNLRTINSALGGEISLKDSKAIADRTNDVVVEVPDHQRQMFAAFVDSIPGISGSTSNSTNITAEDVEYVRQASYALPDRAWTGEPDPYTTYWSERHHKRVIDALSALATGFTPDLPVGVAVDEPPF